MPSHSPHNTRPISDSPRDIVLIPEGDRGIRVDYQTYGSATAEYGIGGGANVDFTVSDVVDATEGDLGAGLVDIYPFSERGPDSVHRAIVDLQISVLNRQVFHDSPAIKLYSVSSGTLPTLGFTFGSGNVSTGNMTVLHNTAWGNRRSITWSLLGDLTITAVLDTRYTSNMSGLTSPITVLDHNVVVRGDQVESLQVKTDSGLVSLNGDTHLVYGYNSEYAHSTEYPSDSIFNASSATLGVTPGAGLGQYKADCDDVSEYIRSINGFSPDENGDITFSMSDCLWSFPGTSGSNPSLAIHADCDACVDCVDFDDLYERLRHIYADAVHIHERVQDIIDKYEYYLYLINRLKDSFDDIDMTFNINKVDDDVLMHIVRLKTGDKRISKVSFNVTWVGNDLEEVNLVPYSRRKKLPGLAPIIVSDDDDDWSMVEPRGPMSVVEDIQSKVPVVRPNVYATWSWYTFITPKDDVYPINLSVSFSATAEEVDENGNVINTHSFSDTINDVIITDPGDN